MASIIYNNIPFDPSDLRSHGTNFALGRFMTAWSQTESLCGFLFRELSQIRHEIANIVFDRIGTREQIEILAELAALIPDNGRSSRAAAALKEVEYISKARNKIVHAGWGQFNGEPARFWHGVTRGHFNEISQESTKGKADRVRFIFTISDIDALTDRCVAVREHLETLLDEIVSEKPHARRSLDAGR